MLLAAEVTGDARYRDYTDKRVSGDRDAGRAAQGEPAGRNHAR